MAEITAALVKELREVSGAGMMDCKKALAENGGKLDEAVDWLRRCPEANRNYTIVHFQLAAALALVGSLDEARASVRAGFALDPAFTIRRTRGLMLSTDPTFRAGSKRIRDGMLIAGVPEGGCRLWVIFGCCPL